MILPGLQHGKEKSGYQEKSGKTKKNDKNQEKSGKMVVFEKKPEKSGNFFFKTSNFFSSKLQNSLYSKALDR